MIFHCPQFFIKNYLTKKSGSNNIPLSIARVSLTDVEKGIRKNKRSHDNEKINTHKKNVGCKATVKKENPMQQQSIE
jgi:hypothetical protein